MKYDIIILGAGPAGYTAAIRAGQLGLKTAIIDKYAIGGMCVHWGCIPMKTMLESAQLFIKIKQAEMMGISNIPSDKAFLNWKRLTNRAKEISTRYRDEILNLLATNEVAIYEGEAVINADRSITVGNSNLEANHIIIATGTQPAKVPQLLKSKKTVDVIQLWNISEIPERIVVYGMGSVAVELAQFFRIMGKSVTVISAKKQLMPALDYRLQEYIEKKMTQQGIKIEYLEEFVTNENVTNKITYNVDDYDMIVNASLRKAVLPQSALNLEIDDKGFLKTTETLSTNQKGLYAIGDVNGKSFLSHVASAQGYWLINHLAGIKGDINMLQFPYNVYSIPELAQIGQTEQMLKDKGVDYMVSELNFNTNVKAIIEDDTEGFVRLLVDKKYGQVLGVQIAGAHATDMIAEASAIMSVEGTLYDLVRAVHAHPTISEIMHLAGTMALDQLRNIDG